MRMTSIRSETPPTPTVLVVGATGWLGRQVTDEVAAAGGRARVGLRNGTAHPQAAELQSIDGVEVVELDLTQPDTLPAAVEGTDVVVSVIQGGPDLLVDGQAALARAAYAAGVRRFFPSDFAVDFTQIPAADHLFFAWRRQAQEAIAATGMAQTNTYNGAFAEMLLPQPMFVLTDWRNAEINYWGSPDQVYDFTATADVARYVAAAALDPEAPDGPFRLAGGSESPAGLAAAAEQVAGRAFRLTQLGTLDELTDEIDRQQAKSPQDPNDWVGLQYFRSMASGAGQLRHLDNARYPQIHPTGVPEFLAQHQSGSRGAESNR